ncbi:LexA family transcriptional regulator [Cytophagaceae bacterium ABcell3]|nr:LexA family transcriptional regulator [Cytophagaceae bacterium ABcell3]
MLVHKNIRFLRVQAGLTQQQFADKIGLGRPLIGQLETGRVVPTLAHLERFSSFFSVSLDQLVKEDLEAQRGDGFTDDKLKILTIAVDKDENELVTLVPQKASAGYLNGFSDPEFIADLPKVSIPGLRNGTFRAFEISGDSMLPLLPGSIVIGKYLPDFDLLKDGQTYLVVTQSDGVVYKRVKVDRNNNKFALVSDNPAYPPYSLPFAEVLELWEASAYISFTFPSPEVSLDSIAVMLQEIKGEIAKKAPE